MFKLTGRFDGGTPVLAGELLKMFSCPTADEVCVVEDWPASKPREGSELYEASFAGGIEPSRSSESSAKVTLFRLVCVDVERAGFSVFASVELGPAAADWLLLRA